MHASLKPKENLALLAVYLVAGSLILFLVPTPLVLFPVGVSVLFGIFCGVCQRKAIRERIPELIAAKTAIQVRAVLMSSTWGRASVYGLYGSVAVRAVVSIAIFFPSPIETLAAWVIGFLAEKFVRETISLPSTMELERASIAAGTSDATQSNPSSS